MDSPELISRIHAVTVFTSGALVTRQADLAALMPRPPRVRLSGLPLSLDDGSLRVRILGGGVVAQDVSIALEVPPADAVGAPAVPEALRAARREETRLALELTLLEARIAQLDQIELPERPQSARGTPPLPTPTAARLALVDFRRREAASLMDARARVREEHRQSAQRLSVLEQVEADASSARSAREHQLRKTVVVDLSWSAGAPAGACTLQLDYLVPGARWVPSYTVRMDRELSRAVVTVQGSVVQTSGEDWNDVQLTASTADALAWSELPELASLRIGRRQAPVRKAGWREPPRGAEQLYQDFDAATARFTPTLAMPVAELLGDREAPSTPMPMAMPMQQRLRAEPLAKSKKMRNDNASFGHGSGGSDDDGASAAAESNAMPAPVAPAPAGALLDRSRSGAPQRSSARTSPGSSAGSRQREQEGESFADESKLGSASPSSLEESLSEPDRPAQEALAYRRLYLGGAQEPGRGQLMAMPVALAYRSVSVRTRVSTVIDIESIIALATDQAEAVRYVPLPARCQLPQTPQFAYSYPACAPATVASDGRWHGVALGESAATIRLEHVTVPREGREVFRVLQLTSPFTTPLLPGPADVYSGEEYLMTADLPLTVSGGTLALGLGVEQGITVARNTTYQEEATGMLSGSLSLHHGISIAIANKLRVPIAIEVRERLPVATLGVDDCKIKLGAVQPPWEDYHQEGQHLEGGHRWKLQLAPGATQTVTASYSVSIPSKSEITAGNRREA